MEFLTRQLARAHLLIGSTLLSIAHGSFEHAEALVRLRGSAHSKGAAAELALARALGLPVYNQSKGGGFFGKWPLHRLEEAK